MNDAQKREELKKAYPNSPKWHKRVDKMSGSQVTAVYIRLVANEQRGK